jgi:ATP adenylyltransferase
MSDQHHHDTLWAPWRLGYVQGRAAEPTAEPVRPRHWRDGADQDCFLCRAAAADAADERSLGVIDRTGTSLVVVNRFPYSNGHLLLAPLDHLPSLGSLAPGQLLELQELLVRWCGVIERTMQAQGFNVGLNLGTAAGAGLPGHLHWHLVPRWSGDVNFMATVAGARVLPQALDSLWEQLTQAARS